jgi:hypothetical protein
MSERASHPATESSRPPTKRMPRPLDGLPWDVAQDAFGEQGAEFLEVFGRVLLRAAQDPMRVQTADTS